MKVRGLRLLAACALAAGILLGTQLSVSAATGQLPPLIAATAQPPPLIIVMMENHGYNAIVGNSAMPYLNELWNEGIQKTGPVVDYTQMYSVASSSMPNYLAITSGSTDGATGSTTPQAGEFKAKSLWDQLTAAGTSWDVFQEAMPSTCYAGGTYNDISAGGTDGEYDLGHNPGTLYASVYTSAECQRDQPLSALSTAALPQVSLVSPNNCDNAHGMTSTQLAKWPYQNCLVGSTALLQRGDGWLQRHVTNWTGAGADVIITWDEGGHIASLMTGPHVTPGRDATTYSHYSVLAGIEKLYGLPLLANATTVSPVPLPGSGTAPAPPQVAITSPTGGSTVSGALTVSGTARASSGATISKVRVSVDNGTSQLASGSTSWTATIDTTALTNGSHTITARATDSNGQVGSTSVTVSVNNSTSVAVTDPGMQSNIAGTKVSLQIQASSRTNSPLTYRASNLPQGLSIDKTTGLISGRLAMVASTVTDTVTVTATTTDGSQGSAAFSWKVSPVTGRIRGYKNECATDYKWGNTPGTPVVIRTCNTLLRERWTLGPNYSLMIRGLCLTDPGWGRWRTKLALEPCHGYSSQKWHHQANGQYVVAVHRLCLTDPRWSTRGGTQLIIQSCRDWANQRWTRP